MAINRRDFVRTSIAAGVTLAAPAVIGAERNEARRRHDSAVPWAESHCGHLFAADAGRAGPGSTAAGQSRVSRVRASAGGAGRAERRPREPQRDADPRDGDARRVPLLLVRNRMGRLTPALFSRIGMVYPVAVNFRLSPDGRGPSFAAGEFHAQGVDVDRGRD